MLTLEPDSAGVVDGVLSAELYCAVVGAVSPPPVSASMTL